MIKKVICKRWKWTVAREHYGICDSWSSFKGQIRQINSRFNEDMPWLVFIMQIVDYIDSKRFLSNKSLQGVTNSASQQINAY